MASEVRVEPLRRMEELHLCEELQRRIWGFREGELVPAIFLRAALDHGGLVLGAFVDDRLVGMAFSIAGFSEGRLHHHSDMTGVVPEHRHRGLGFRLKLEQRLHALSQGVDLITWTSDPLEGPNSHLNFHKLGAIAARYAVDYYGPMRDAINRGLPTDRLMVEWHLKDPHVIARAEGRVVGETDWSSAPAINTTQPAAGGLRGPTGHHTGFTDKALLMEIPWDLQAVKAQAPDLALAWRLEARAILLPYLARRYEVVDFMSDRKYRRNFLVLVEGGS